MFLHKIFVSIVLFFSTLGIHVYAMHSIPQIDLDHGIVQGARAYSIHGYACNATPTDGSCDQIQEKRCLCFCFKRWGNNHVEYKTTDCLSKNLIKEHNNKLIVTYYNKRWKIIAWQDLTDLQAQQLTMYVPFKKYKEIDDDEVAHLHRYCLSHLDPKFKPEIDIAQDDQEIRLFDKTYLDYGLTLECLSREGSISYNNPLYDDTDDDYIQDIPFPSDSGHRFFQGAVGYSIHGYACSDIAANALPNQIPERHCLCFCPKRWRNQILERKISLCPNRNVIDHNDNKIIITYHNKHWQIIALQEIIDHEQNEEKRHVSFEEYKSIRADEIAYLHNHCLSYLDPTCITQR